MSCEKEKKVEGVLNDDIMTRNTAISKAILAFPIILLPNFR